MTKEEKLVVIDSLAEQLQAYPHFYIADIESLNAEQTAALRRKCFESDVKLVVVKNTLLGKALEKVEKADADLVKVLEGPTSIMFTNVAKAPAVLIKEFRKANPKPVLKAACVEDCIFCRGSGMHNHCDSGKYGIRTSYFLWNDHSEFDYRNPSWICIGTGFLFGGLFKNRESTV